MIPKMNLAIVGGDSMISDIFRVGDDAYSVNVQVVVDDQGRGIVDDQGRLLVTHRRPKAIIDHLGRALVDNTGKYLVAI